MQSGSCLEGMRGYAAAMWSAEQAREMARKGAASRWARERARKAALNQLSGNGQMPGVVAHDSGFVARRLNRVRAQLDLLDTAVETELAKSNPDGQKLNWLAATSERLSNIERTLDGRPLPGSRRPAPESSRPAPPPLARPTIAQPLRQLTERPEW